MERKIGILVVNGPLPPPFGGVATYLAHTLPYLAANGFEVHTVIDRRPIRPSRSEQASTGPYEQFERAGVHIHYGGGSRLWKVVQMIKHLPLWIAAWRQSGARSSVLLQSAKSIVSWLDATERVLQRHRIDIIHAYDYPWVQGFVAAHLARKYGKKYAQTTFGEVVPHRDELIHHDAWGDRYRPFSHYVLKQCDLLMSVSKHCAQEVNTVGLNEERVRVTYYGIDVGRFAPAADAGDLHAEFGLKAEHVVLFLGQVRLRKGPQVLLEAAPLVLAKLPGTVFVIAGPDFGITARLRERARELGVEEQIIFLGPQPEEKLPALFNACDVFVFPSTTAIECLGLSTVQAMACAKPVVGSRIDGIPEVIVDGVTGFLVEPNDHHALADKIAALLSDEELRTRMGRSGRQRAVEHFDREKLVKEIEQLYHELTAV